MKKGTRVILIENIWCGIPCGKVGRVVFVPPKGSGRKYMVQFAVHGVWVKPESIVPVMDVTEWETALSEREYQRFWLKFRTAPAIVTAIASYVIGVWFLLEPSYPFYINLLVAFVMLAFGIGLAVVAKIDNEQLEEKLNL